MTKQLKIGSRGFHCEVVRVSTVSTVKFENEIRRRSVDRGSTKITVGCDFSELCILHVTLTSGRPEPIIIVLAVRAIDIRSTAIHCYDA